MGRWHIVQPGRMACAPRAGSLSFGSSVSYNKTGAHLNQMDACFIEPVEPAEPASGPYGLDPDEICRRIRRWVRKLPVREAGLTGARQRARWPPWIS